MKKNTILLVSANYPAQNSIRNYLNTLFSGYLAIDTCLFSQLETVRPDDYPLILFSSEEVRSQCVPLLSEAASWVTCQRIVDYNQLAELLDIMPGEDIYLVNDNRQSTAEVIGQLSELGLRQYRFIPYYPGCPTEVKRDATAVTVGEVHLVPPEIGRTVDIGSRIVDMSTICEIVTFFGLPLTLVNDVVRSYNRHITRLLASSISQVDAIYKTQKVTRTIMENMNSGVCLADSHGQIEMVNEVFYQMMALTKRDIIGKSLEEVLRKSGIDQPVDSFQGQSRVVVNRNGQHLVTELRSVGDKEVRKALILTVDYTEDITSKEIVIRREARVEVEGSRSLYRFEDYITEDAGTLQFLERAKKIAKVDSDVLIQGESGTGKEIVAQAIHENSHRKNQPFVAVNFAAIQENLLESELFGYEEGSFTGAKKGGKKGLFEEAHRGTIFLDEIGDAPMSFQTRLLRALQEREIRRVGGNERIPVDVRVIAATNQNLYERVKQGLFRQDLFFRIGVLPLETVPLRKRRGDIPLLLNYYSQNYFNSKAVSIDRICAEELRRFLMEYRWPGNVRELMNLCRYFSCIALPEKIQLRDLPEYMKMSANEETGLSAPEQSVLQILRKHPKTGRAGISAYLKEAGMELGEGQVRRILNDLAKQDLIRVNRTRGGCELTGKALMLLG